MNFQPTKVGLISVDDNHTFHLIKNKKVVAKFFYFNYKHGIKYEWFVVKVIHQADGTTFDQEVFKGTIINQHFVEHMIRKLNR